MENVNVFIPSGNGKVRQFNHSVTGDYVFDENKKPVQINSNSLLYFMQNGKLTKLNQEPVKNNPAASNENKVENLYYGNSFCEIKNFKFFESRENKTGLARYGFNQHGRMVKVTNTATYGEGENEFFIAVDGSRVLKSQLKFASITEMRDKFIKENESIIKEQTSIVKESQNIKQNQNSKFKYFSPKLDPSIASVSPQIDVLDDAYLKSLSKNKTHKTAIIDVSLSAGKYIQTESKEKERCLVFDDNKLTGEYKYAEKLKDATHVIMDGQVFSLNDENITLKDDYIEYKDKAIYGPFLQEISYDTYYAREINGESVPTKIDLEQKFSIQPAAYPKVNAKNEGRYFIDLKGRLINKETVQIYKKVKNTEVFDLMGQQLFDIKDKFVPVNVTIGKGGSVISKEKINKAKQEIDKQNAAEAQSDNTNDKNEQAKKYRETETMESVNAFDEDTAYYYNDGNDFIEVDVSKTYDLGQTELEVGKTKKDLIGKIPDFKNKFEINKDHKKSFSKIWKNLAYYPAIGAAGLVGLTTSLGPFIIVALGPILAGASALLAGGVAAASIASLGNLVKMGLDKLSVNRQIKKLKNKPQHEKVIAKAMDEYTAEKTKTQKKFLQNYLNALNENQPLSVLNNLKQTYLDELRSEKMQELLAIVRGSEKNVLYKKGDKITGENIDSYWEQINEKETEKLKKKNAKKISQLQEQLADIKNELKITEDEIIITSLNGRIKSIESRLKDLQTTKYTQSRNSFKAKTESFLEQTGETEIYISKAKGETKSSVNYKLNDQKFVLTDKQKTIDGKDEMKLNIYKQLNATDINDIKKLFENYNSKDSQAFTAIDAKMEKFIMYLNSEHVNINAKEQSILDDFKNVAIQNLDNLSFDEQSELDRLKDKYDRSALDAIVKKHENFATLKNEFEKSNLSKQIKDNAWEKDNNLKLKLTEIENLIKQLTEKFASGETSQITHFYKLYHKIFSVKVGKKDGEISYEQTQQRLKEIQKSQNKEVLTKQNIDPDQTEKDNADAPTIL